MNSVHWVNAINSISVNR